MALLKGGTRFDAIWVQFYNNYCGLHSFVPGASQQPAFNLDQWEGWAKGFSQNRDVKVFIGVPAAPSAAGSGYLPVDALRPVLQFAKAFSSFGGVMMWDVSQAYANGDFIGGVKRGLTG